VTLQVESSAFKAEMAASFVNSSPSYEQVNVMSSCVMFATPGSALRALVTRDPQPFFQAMPSILKATCLMAGSACLAVGVSGAATDGATLGVETVSCGGACEQPTRAATNVAASKCRLYMDSSYQKQVKLFSERTTHPKLGVLSEIWRGPHSCDFDLIDFFKEFFSAARPAASASIAWTELNAPTAEDP
jgi:hypothetical protein